MTNWIITVSILCSFTAVSQVSLNEVQSSNNSTLADNMGEFDDWIEIHNSTDSPIEIGGLILKDQIDTWTIPTGNPSTLLPPGGYFLLWADDQEFQGEFHTNFKIASGGEFLGLYESDGVTVIDSLTLPAIESDDSFIRCAAGWIQTSVPSPLAENECWTTIDESSFEDLFNVSFVNKEQIKIHLVKELIDPTLLTIHSMWGKEIYREQLVDNDRVLDINGLDFGVYIITISTADFSFSKKVTNQF